MNPISGVVLYNQYGRLDPSRPFQPFGIQPSQGSYLLVGSSQFITQRPESVTLRIEWQNLPASFDFARHYASYGVPVENSSFKVGASYLSGGQWLPINLTDPSLFKTVPGSPSLVSEFALELPPTLTPLSQEAASRPLEYNQNTTDGFFRLELTEPAFGFGAEVYTQAVSAVMLKNASSILENSSGEKLPLPNPPFTPIATGISIFLGSANHFPVTDAGAILAWPFLNTLFERAGISNSDVHLDHLRAVSLLLYITWGISYQEHHASPLLKILSGLPPESELPPPLQLTNDEMNLCDSLLTALIDLWEIVKNTSNDGIRNTFFQRNGRLANDQDQYVLSVERKPFDMLLDKLPWALSMLKLPWMDRVLMVQWR